MSQLKAFWHGRFLVIQWDEILSDRMRLQIHDKAGARAPAFLRLRTDEIVVGKLPDINTVKKVESIYLTDF